MILVDTSAWVEYDRATGSRVHRRLAELIASSAAVAITEPIVMEVLVGAQTDAREAGLRRFFLRFHLLPFEATVDFDGAERIYRRCQAAGVTPRGLLDCMIVAVAWRHGATLLTRDADMTGVATVIGVDIDAASVANEPERQ